MGMPTWSGLRGEDFEGTEALPVTWGLAPLGPKQTQLPGDLGCSWRCLAPQRAGFHRAFVPRMLLHGLINYRKALLFPQNVESLHLIFIKGEESAALTLFGDGWNPQCGCGTLSERIVGDHRHPVGLAAHVQLQVLVGGVHGLCEVGAVFWKVLYEVAERSLQERGSSCLLHTEEPQFIAKNKEGQAPTW